MINIVLFEPEIPGNTGNIMRTCVATKSKLHLLKEVVLTISINVITQFMRISTTFFLKIVVNFIS